MPAWLDALHTFGTETAVVLWLPVAVWSLLALALGLFVRPAERLHPTVAYGIVRALLYALPAGIGLAAVTERTLLAPLAPPPPVPGAAVPLPPVDLGALPAPPPALDAFHALGVLTTVFAAVALLHLVRLALDAAALRRFARTLPARGPAWLRAEAARCAGWLGLHRAPRVVLAEAAVPLAFGALRPVVVLPRALEADRPALRLALLHELVHVRRSDAAAHAAERLLGAVFAAHPLVGWLRAHVERLRETTCDLHVLACPDVGRRAYAELLFRFLVPGPALGLGLTTSADHLKSRLHAMKDFARANRFTHPRLVSGLVIGLVLVSAAVGVAALSNAVAPAEHEVIEEVIVLEEIETPLDERMPPPPPAPAEEVFVIVEQPPDLIGGIEGIQSRIRYPRLARMAGVEGMVVTQFVVGTDGRVRDVRVLRGPGSGLDEEAMRVVREARFEPGRQRGRAVPVKMSLPVRFKLNEAASEAKVRTKEEALFAGADRIVERAAAPAAERTLSLAVESIDVRSTGRYLGGRIAGTDGLPLPGVNVAVEGTTAGAVTNIDGRFRLRLPDGAETIRVQAPGYAPRQYALRSIASGR